MHPALLIDEILEVILECCSEWPQNEYHRTLAQLARCCRAWQDPALDRLWSRLQGTDGLLRLLGPPQKAHSISEPAGLNSVHESNTTPTAADIAFARLRFYASRVKAIIHGPGVVPPLGIDGDGDAVLLPKLTSVHFLNAGCLTPPCWSVSPSVREVAAYLGFKIHTKPVQAAQTESYCASLVTYLDRLLQIAASLEALSLRGIVSGQMESRLASYTSLRVLRIHVGPSLSAETFAAIATTFPVLRDLSIDVKHIDAAEFQSALPQHASGLFPSMRNLQISAQPSLLEAVLSRVSINELQVLHMNVNGARGSSALLPVFKSVSDRTSGSLRSLTIEYFPDDAQPPEMGGGAGVTNGTADPREQTASDWFTIELLRPLARLAQLRQLTLSAPLPALLTDKHAGDLGGWWPNLEDLDLGTREPDAGDWGRGLMTPAAYAALARACPKLRSLALPVELPACIEGAPIVLPGVPGAPSKPPHAIASPVRHAVQCVRAGISPAAASAERVTELVQFLRSLFPSATLEGTSQEEDALLANCQRQEEPLRRCS